MEGKWLSVLEFATYKGKSISTVRRYVKADRVKHKEENGKYFIWVKNFINNELSSEKEMLEMKLENGRLKKDLHRLTDEVSELRMLVTIYESEKTITPELPEIPSEL
jgi:hypothetical protein